MNSPIQLLTPGGVAKRLGVSPITVRSWATKGWLASQLTPGGHRRYHWEDIERLLAQRSHARDTAEVIRVLVVDDDQQFRAYLVDALALLLPTATVREARNGFQAGLEVSAFSPHVVLLDYAMPGLDGAEVCRLIKSNPTHATIKIVAITAFTDPTITATLTQAGADKVLYKPTPLTKLQNLLEEYGYLPSATDTTLACA